MRQLEPKRATLIASCFLGALLALQALALAEPTRLKESKRIASTSEITPSGNPALSFNLQQLGRMLPISAGDYLPLYGRRDTPQHVTGFALDVWPVSNAQYLRFVALHPRYQRGKLAELFADEDYLKHWQAPLSLGERAPLSSPVTQVSWFAARAYCKSVGKRLPTLDEWEYVARASATSLDASQDPVFTETLLSWYSRPTPSPLPSAASGLTNYWGISSMHGLVWEWVEDFNSILMTGESRKDSGALDSQLYCAAGSVGSVDPSNYAAFMRYAMRASVRADYTVQSLGFRCARDL